jgi:ABC-type glycerol-3-phosphate transport system permease component
MSVGMALKPINELFIFPPRFLPASPTLNNFKMLFSLLSSTWVPFSRYLFNTVFTTVIITVSYVLVGSMAAFPLAKNEFSGKKVINLLVLYALMFVPAINDIANYLTVSWLGWIDTYWAIIIPALGAPLGLFIMRNYMTTIPTSLLEAAKIDGCNEISTYARVVMPIVKPAWLTVGVLTFQAIWNSANSVYIYREELKTLPYALSQIVTGGIVRLGAGQAVGVLMLLVPTIVFIATQTTIINTMATSGIKE